ncbi:LacI family DNA-binding transcriptional regulator [Flavitalea antarctica]
MKKSISSKKDITTIYDIAKTLNVSGSTVSRALRDHPDISAEMIDKIKKTAKKLNYKPNMIAQSLKERRTKIIAVILPEVLNPFYMSVLNGIEELSFRKGYHVIVAKTNESYQREVMQVQSLAGQVDGLLVCVSQETKNYEHFKAAKQQNIPLVFFERAPEKLGGNSVIMNDESIAITITEHLLKSGYKRIGLLTGGDHLNVVRNQIRGYTEQLKKHNIEIDENLIVKTGMSFQQGRIGFQKMMRLKQPPDAIFAAGEQITLAVYSECKKMGLKIPTDIGLVGFSSDPLLSLLTPSVTSVGQKGFEMGSMAAQLCINEIEGEGTGKKKRTEILSNDLIIRQSSIKSHPTEVPGSYSNYSLDKTADEPLVYIY